MLLLQNNRETFFSELVEYAEYARILQHAISSSKNELYFSCCRWVQVEYGTVV